MSGLRLGCFVRDPTLKEFLKSSQAVAASLEHLYGWLKSKSESDCRDIIEDYVVNGGDGGITAVTIREACGLALMADTLPDNPPAEVKREITSAATPGQLSLIHI